jgi:hypothetical protein
MTDRVRAGLTTKAAVVVLAVLLPAVTARADIFTSPATAPGSGSGASAATPPPDSHWYGWQILAADLVTLGTLSLCTSAADAGIDADYCALTVIPWVTGAAAIHWAGHGNPLRALVSVALHAGLPLAGAYLGDAARCDGCAEEGDMNVLIGVVAGVVFATLLDTAFSIEAVPRAPAVSRRSGPTLTPTLATGGGALGLGLAGTF